MKTWSNLGTLDLSWSRVPPPENENLVRLGFELVQSNPPSQMTYVKLVCGD